MKTLTECKIELINQIKILQQNELLPAVLNFNRGIFRGLIEVWAYGLERLYNYIAQMMEQIFPITASGEYLDKHCDQIGLQRIKATKTLGWVCFTRDHANNTIIIPKDTIVQTKIDNTGNQIQFKTIEKSVIAANQKNCKTQVECLNYGYIGNVPGLSITEISTPIQDVTVLNNSDWIISEGIDDENDEQLKNRYVLAWKGISGCNISAYKSWVYSEKGVLSCEIITGHPRGQGTIDIIVLGMAGMPSNDLINRIQNTINIKKPLNDNVLVKSPNAIDCNINLNVQLKNGYDESSTIIEIKNQILALFDYSNENCLKIGETLYLDRLIYVIMATGKVDSIDWVSPTTDIQVQKDELVILQSLEIGVNQ